MEGLREIGADEYERLKIRMNPSVPEGIYAAFLSGAPFKAHAKVRAGCGDVRVR
jgi:hypothetical protein